MGREGGLLGCEEYPGRVTILLVAGHSCKDGRMMADPALNPPLHPHLAVPTTGQLILHFLVVGWYYSP